MDRHLGMYIHAHWGYNHPYAARTWTLDDWRGYASGLSGLGYDLVMIWPILDTMPNPPTASDSAYLRKLGQVIDMLHSEFGMQALIVVSANTIANEDAVGYDFEKRPFFGTDRRLNPGDPLEVELLFDARRALLSYLSGADGVVVIDSDPGGYIGSTNDEFAGLLSGYVDLTTELNPAAKLYYWMWFGWEAYNEFWRRASETGELHIAPSADDCEYAVRELMAGESDSWGLLAGMPSHHEIAGRLGLEDRSIFLTYGAVEGEPTFPLTGYNPPLIHDVLQPFVSNPNYPACMGNAQTHVAQLPNTYLFSHFAKGGSVDAVDLVGFAERLLPGHGEKLAQAWQAMVSPTSEAAREALPAVRALADGDLAVGPLSGLMLDGVRRYVQDLALQLAFYADMLDSAEAVRTQSDHREALAAVCESWNAWVTRTGFVDAYGGPFYHILHPALRELHNANLDAVLNDFEDWKNPVVRHGIVPRLIEAMRNCAKKH